MTSDTLTALDNIKSLFSQVKDKTGFMKALSEANGRTPASLYNNWFCRFWAIPEAEHQNVIAFLQNYLKLQNEKEKAN